MVIRMVPQAGSQKSLSGFRLVEQGKRAGRDTAEASSLGATCRLALVVLALGWAGCQGSRATKERKRLMGKNEARRIQDAAAAGNVEALRSWLDADPNLAAALDPAGSTVLHVAAEKGQNEVVKLLLEKRADPNAARAGGVVPLHLTVFADNLVGAGLLLDAGANIHTRDTAGWSAVYIAAAMNHREMVKYLRRRGAAGDAFVAAGMGDLSTVKKAVAKNSNVIQPRPDSGFSLLHIAAAGGRKDVVAFLLSAGSRVDAKTREGTPLILAVMMGHQKVARLLIESGADVNASDQHGYTPLHFAASQGQVAVAELLIAHGGRGDAKAKNGKTPLCLARTKGRKRLVDLLSKHDAGPKER